MTTPDPIIAASRDAMAPGEPQQWHYTRDPLDGISLWKMALWLLVLIPLHELYTRIRKVK